MDAKPPRWKPSTLLFWIPIGALVILLFIADNLQYQYMIPLGLQINSIPNIIQDNLKGFLIKTSGCRIPYMEPFDHTIDKFIHKEKLPVCNDGIPALVDSNLTSIFIVNSSVANYTDDIDALNCCYQAFRRQEPNKDESDNKIRFDRNCIKFNYSVNISEEFIKVKCHINKSIVYTDFFSFIPIKTNKTNNEKKLNVLVIGLDAVSRLNFHRQMPKTLEFLKNISAVELLGYNKVGDNTFPNLIPFLTGLSEKQLEEVCWNTKNDKRFDGCPFIWKDYKSRGYTTSFGEDSSWMGIFNYMRRGFKKQPTDYMWGTFNRFAESDIGNSHNMNVEECIGAREVYKILLNHILNFVITMDKAQLSYFAFYWGASLSHDYLNKPNLGDKTYKNFFKKLKSSGLLDNTALIFMSDHGIRWGDIRQTYQGQMEERLPFVFMLLPDWFKSQNKNAYNNLVKNARSLTTPYDMHKTLNSFLNITPTRVHENMSLSYSLFDVIPTSRTCASAGIASHWCTCQQSAEISTNDSLVQNASSFVVEYMNEQLEGYAQCSNLTLSNITQARVMTHGDHIKNRDDIKDYMIILETIPGNGVFEVTVRTKLVDKERKFEIMGTISRLNLYGKQSACITDFHLKLYCFCKTLL